MKADTVQVDFYDDNGNPVSAIDLYAESDGTGPFTISPEEAAENNEARVQLLENTAYEYQLRDSGFRLREEPEIVRPSRVRSDRDRGRITPGLNVGRVHLVLLDSDDKRVGSTDVEVRAAKITYRDEYRHMLEYITDRCTDLLLEFRSPVDQGLLPEDAREPETVCQRFAFVRSLITSRKFRDAVQRVIALPHRLWKQEEDEIPLGRGTKASSSLARQIASASCRVPLRADHPLATRISSVPSHVTVLRNVETLDTSENRFMKHALVTFQAFVADVRERLQHQGRESDARVIEEAVALEEELGEVLNRDFFRAVSDPDILPLGSPVLQRKGGYREILTAWLQFDMAARLCWAGGVEVYGAGKRDVATLYEYWVFLKLLDVVADIFNLEQPAAKSLIEPTEDGFGLKLRSGRHIPIEGNYVAEGGGRKLKVRFSYNRTFPRRGPDAEENFASGGSWTERMRPDYTLTLWPAAFTEDEAEREEIIVHVHFDAKYRVEDISDIFGETDDKFRDEAALERDLTSDKAQERQGRYCRADLLKMHAYKDAIRRTAGAYVLYPGTERRKWRGFHEIIPGLGAFGIRPCGENDDGTTALKDFILQIVNHVCDRATRREQETFHRYRVQDAERQPKAVKESPSPEYQLDRRRTLPPAETPVLVAWYVNDLALRWIREQKLIVLRAGERRGAIPLTPEYVGIRYVLLHKEDYEAAVGLFAIEKDRTGKPRPPEILSATTLKRKYNYPLKTRSDYYIVFHVEPKPHYAGTRWNIRKLLEKRGISPIRSPLPFCAMLDEVMDCKI